mgnify:CR=1 FL=1|tara:strand:- start:1548 stop:2183 length:636 start_codon:yes stop_codon:yes gene_type:complete
MLEGYEILENGVILQSDKRITMKYDEDYISSSYTEENMLRISYLRLGFLLSVLHGENINGKDLSILDVGCGFGHFLKVSKNFGFDTYGLDINDHDISEFANKGSLKSGYDIVTFFDSLEHFDDINFVKDLDCQFILISLPWCHHHRLGDEWFKNWKHRKRGEHLWHFSEQSLNNFLNDQGYDVLLSSNFEDSLRTPVDSNPNILTMFASKR